LQINSEINEIQSYNQIIHLIEVTNEKGIKEAVDFTWRSSSGLRLKADWAYSEGEINKSFEMWLNGH